MEGPLDAPARPRLLHADERARFAFTPSPETFEVEELPVEPPAGEGEHLWLWIEKRGVSTEDALVVLARRLGVPRRRASHAGRKDVHALARQWLAFEGASADAASACTLGEELATAPGAGLRVLAVSRHPRGLRPGGTRGNRFRIVLREVERDGHERLARGLATLVQRGTPAWYGAQRFGVGAASAAGLALLCGDAEGFAQALLAAPAPGAVGRVAEARELARTGDFAGAERAFPPSFALERSAARALAGGIAPAALAERLARRDLAFLVSAAQAALFDEVLLQRFPALDRVETGDVAHLHATRGSFLVEDAAAEQPRAERFELSPTAPIFGRRMRPRPTERPRAIEDAVLAAAGLDDAALERHMASREGPWRVEGTRRPLRWPLTEPAVERPDATTARLRFALPAGAYATEVLAELGAASVNGGAGPG